VREPTPPTDAGEPPPAVGRLIDDLRALDRAYAIGHHGRWSAARRAEIVDGCLRDLFGTTATASGLALVALGGYGRGALSPGSDIDLLILYDGPNVDDVAALAGRLLYPLWDAGLRVGHAARTPIECADASAGLDAATAMLDGRLLAGDDVLWERGHAAVLERVRRDPRAFATGLVDDRDVRRGRFGSVSSLLEPELKEGAGGLRDVQALGWLQVAVGASLEQAGLVRAAERRAVDEAEEFLVRVRSALHLETGRGSDRLVLEQQPPIAAGMGFVDEPGLPSVDGLMRSVFEHARQVEHVISSAFDRYLRGSSPLPEVEPTPAGILRAFVTVVREQGVMPAAALDAMTPTTIAAGAWPDEVRDAFLELLRSGPEAAAALETLDRIGLLERYLPAWSDVRCRPQRDPYHRSSVDVHLVDAFAAAASLLDDAGDDPLAVEAASAIEDRDGLLLGALLHDIGKTGRGEHVAVGADVARGTLEHMGVAGATADLARFLVSEHLLLSDTATRRDLEDEELVHGLATTIGQPSRLAALCLLTIADARATGPLAWTPWRSALLRELVAKVGRVLERGDVEPGTAERLSGRADQIRAALEGEDPAEVERFLMRMPRGYVSIVQAERVAAHFGLVARPMGAREVRTAAAEGTRPGTYELAVAAADRAGLLSMIAGALTLAGLSILTAQVFTTEDGVAVDLFEVEGAFEAEVGEERWRDVRGTLRRAIEGRLSLDHRVHAKRAHYPEPRQDVPVRVTIDNDASDFFTVVEVGAPDRLGLLFDVTRALAELRLDVHIAKVATYGVRVVDAFYVRDALGRRVEDPDRIGEIEQVLRSSLGGGVGLGGP
jgi:[protein-PII] uridylyltransferase